MHKTKEILWAVLRKNGLQTALLFAIVLCVVGLSLLPPQILRRVIDGCLLSGRAEGLPLLAALYFGSFLLIGLFDCWKGLAITVLGQKIVRALRSEMAEKLTRIRAGYFSRTPGGTIASHLINDVEAVDTLFSDGILAMGIDCLKVVGIVGSIWLFSVPLGLFTLCLLPLLYGLTAFFRRRMLASQTANLQELGRVNNQIAESLKNALMLKVFHKEAYMEARYADILQENYATMERVNFYDSCYSPLIQLLTAGATAAVLLLAAGETGLLSIGEVAATVTLLTGLFTPVDNLGMELQRIQKGISGLHRVDAFLALEEDAKTEAPMDTTLGSAAFRFDDVSFSYEPGTPVLSHLNLQVAAGEHICFVGRTGVGKSTLFRLICGLLPPTEGRVTLDGVETYAIPSAQKRQLFGYVEQQFHFVQGTVAEQITLRDPSISRTQMQAAMEFVGLQDRVLDLEQGYETPAEPSQFSQGQKQLLSIARAIVTDPPVLLLDEMTAGLDAATEARVLALLQQAGEGKTIFSITHRPSSIRAGDRVIPLE
ncbi:MAG: ABC transporter ATP-binding protein [Oscillospiraceae bacterium]